MNPLLDILARNQGQVLTPELIAGILHSFDLALPEQVYSVMPIRSVPCYTGTADPRLIYADRERVGAWVAQRVGMESQWGSFAALGLLDRPGGELVAGTVLSDITATNACAHVAFEGKHALKRVLLHAFFDYAFNQLDLHRLTGLVDADNHAALQFDQHLGFEYEFTIRDGNAGDIIQLVMWRETCRWLRRHSDGQKST
jgi:RimJ/RimL family protein N-acetyltransferase